MIPINNYLKDLIRGFVMAISITSFVAVFALSYLTGLVQGYNFGKSDAEIRFIELVNNKLAQTRTGSSYQKQNMSVSPSPTLTPKISWGGPELWAMINKRRVELGVNALGQRDELCTIASLRLNELLELGRLDGHEGFADLEEERPDLKWIFNGYSVIAEFLATGGKTAQATVNLWENTLGHRKIVDGGEYVWGCIYAQEGFAVGILAY